MVQQSIPVQSQLFSYSFLALPLVFAGLPIYIHAPEIYASQLGVSLTSIGVVLLVLRMVDAVQDPLIGSLSDKFHHLRNTIIILGALMMVVGFWLIFHPITSRPLLGFTLGVFICTTGFSIVAINFHTLVLFIF